MSKQDVGVELTQRIAVRCSNCHKLIFYKMSASSGIIEYKCSRCGATKELNLALRKRIVPVSNVQRWVMMH